MAMRKFKVSGTVSFSSDVMKYCRKIRVLLLLILVLAAGGIYLSIKSYVVWNETCCKIQLKAIYSGIDLYRAHYYRLPDYQKWYDLLIQVHEGDFSAEGFMCPTQGRRKREGTYIINEDFDKTWNMPPDSVLVFEGDKGWNQFGSIEDIRPLHRGGCHVLFSNGDIKFIQEKDFANLVWK